MGECDKAICWLMTHHPAHPNLLPLLPRMPWKRLSEQYFKPGEELKCNSSLAPPSPLASPPPFSPLGCENSHLLVVIGASSCPLWRSRVLGILQGVSRSCSLEMDWLDFCGGVLLSSCCQGKMLCYKILMYSITVRVCSWINWLNMYVMAGFFSSLLPIKFLFVEYFNLSHQHNALLVITRKLQHGY